MMRELSSQKEQQIYEYQLSQRIAAITEELDILKVYLEDSDLTDIMINQDGSVFTDGYETGMLKRDINVNIPARDRIIKLLAGWNKKIISEKEPFLSGRLPTKERFEIVTGEVTNFQPTITIRKPPSKIFTFDDYIESGNITLTQRNYLEKILENKKNILVVGPTGCGKTSFISSCVNELKGTKDRVATVEEVEEIIVAEDENKNPLIENLLRYTTTSNISALKILKSLMRQYVDRIIFGEIRYGVEAETLLDGWNTGHKGGLTSIHANTALDGLDRLVELLMEEKPIERPYMVARGIDVVVALDKKRDSSGLTRRFINEIIEVKYYDKNNEKFIYEVVL